MLDSIIFDIDGTIWDTRYTVVKAWEKAIKNHTDLPWNFTAEQIGGYFGLPMDEIFRRMFPGLSDERIAELEPIFYEYEHDCLKAAKVQPYEGVREALEVLSKKYPLYIVTNGQKGYAEVMLESTGLGEFFKGWLCFGDTRAEKAVTIKTLMEREGLVNSVYIGDTLGDQDASKKAGIPFVFCEYGLGQVDNPEYSIKHMSELEAVVDSL